MKAPLTDLTISIADLEVISPFCFVIDSSSTLRFVGKALREIYPEMKLGQPLSAYFSATASDGELDFASMSKKRKTVLPLKGLRHTVLLRGPMLLSKSKDLLIYAGSPDIEDDELLLSSPGLSGEDFAVQAGVFESPQAPYAKPAMAKNHANAQIAEIQSLGGDELVEELLTEFQLQVESDLEEISEAFRTSGFAEVARLAHRLKGGSITVGMQTVTSMCTDLELAAGQKNRRQVSSAIDNLIAEVKQMQSLRGHKTDRSRSIRILIADDHPVVRFGVRRMLQGLANYIVVGESADGKEAIRQMKELQPDILLLDLNMPSLPGLDTLRELTTIQIPTKTILLTSAISQREVLEALQLGARGVVLKDALATDISECISTVMQGHYWLGSKPVQNLVQVLNDLMEEIKQPPQNTFGLTARELQVVRLIAQGLTNKDIAQECKIAEETVKRHLKNIFDKVGVWNRLELALFAINNHLVAEPMVAA
jgi:DNA-binding NarL/FixJ family response regulator/HPt (histidine-containing phosphotransfer) domain-containing protein